VGIGFDNDAIDGEEGEGGNDESRSPLPMLPTPQIAPSENQFEVLATDSDSESDDSDYSPLGVSGCGMGG
jgi:hypothetical protein